VRAVGLTEQLCPHALTLDVSDEADVIIGDVNHAMSPWGTSGRLFSDDNARGVVLVIDEVHQLVERMRDHGSPRLQAAALRKAVAQLRAWGAERFGPWIMLMLDALDAVDDVVRRTPGPLVDGSGLAELALDPWRALATRVEELALDYLRLRPTGEEAADPTLEACYALLRFVELAEVADEGTVALARVRPGEEEVRLLSLDPGPMILERVVRLGGFIGCSATLSPHEAWRAQLGLPETTRRVEVPSPFPPERRRVFVAPEVSTAWRSRQRDADATAAVVARVVENVPGNVAVFAPSFEMLESVLTRAALTRPILRQRAGATEPEHAALLDALAEAPSPVVLAAVTGGVFGEGIDLPPGALSAVVILGPALPPPDLERRLIRDHLEAKLQKGFVYAFLLPGLVRVAQAAGRLVRRAEDRGVIVLVDQRFATAGVQKYLPAAWTPEVPADLGAAIAAFFHDEQPVLGADAAAAEP
jgi:DNA excision repair protein ERCC-2